MIYQLIMIFCQIDGPSQRVGHTGCKRNSMTLQYSSNHEATAVTKSLPSLLMTNCIDCMNAQELINITSLLVQNGFMLWKTTSGYVWSLGSMLVCECFLETGLLQWQHPSTAGNTIADISAAHPFLEDLEGDSPGKLVTRNSDLWWVELPHW